VSPLGAARTVRSGEAKDAGAWFADTTAAVFG
jgi:hypothetical protein